MTASADNSEWSNWSNVTTPAGSLSSSSSSSTWSTASTAEEFESVISIDESSSGDQRSVELPADKVTRTELVMNFVLLFVPPIVHWLPRYTLKKFELDVLASVSVVSALIPQAIAFTQLAHLSVGFAFHSAGVAPIVYAMLGTSHVTSIGPIALLAILSGDAVARLGLDPVAARDEFEQASIALACLTGVLLLAFGMLRLGVIVRFIAQPVMAGFLTATGITIVILQLQHLFGVTIPAVQPTVFHTLYYVCAVLDTTNLGALVTSICSLAFLLIAWRVKERIHRHKWLRLFPDQLVLMVLSTTISWAVGLERNYGTIVIGSLPQTFPKPTIPDVRFMGPLFVDALLIALVGFAQSIGMSFTYAEDTAFRIEPSQEFVAQGVAEIVASFFSAFVVTGGLTRTSLAAAAGAATPLHGVFVGILAILFGFISDLLYHLPRATLSSAIVLSAHVLIDVGTMCHLWRVDRPNLLLLALTVAITLGLGVQNGLLASLAISIALVVVQAARAHSARLGLLAGTKDTFLNVRRFRNAREIPGVLIFHYDAQLFFANAQHFVDELRAEVTHSRREGHLVRSVVVDCSAIGSIDSPAMELLLRTERRFERHRIRVMFAHVNGPVRDMFRRFDIDCNDPARFQPSLRAALMRLSSQGFARVDLASRRPSLQDGVVVVVDEALS
jgi:SulP family sulfate permease